MVTVIGFLERKSLGGKVYCLLELQSKELEFVVSKTTGKMYATVNKCRISSTFDAAVCKSMIGM